MKLVVAVVD